MRNLKIKNGNFADLSKKIYACFQGEEEVYEFLDFFVDVEESRDSLTVKVWQMYDYLPMNFKVMTRIAEAIGTSDFNVNQWSFSGCETCDYGSRYEHEITFKREKVDA